MRGVSGATESITGVLLSGGLDSSILLAYLLRQGTPVQPIYLRTGVVWQCEELRAVRAFLKAIAEPALGELAILELPLGDLYQGHWSVTGRQTPGWDSPDDAVFLPGRNALLLLKPTVWCQMHGIGRLALGVLGSNPFPDATAEFFAAWERATSLGLGTAVQIVRPFERLGKREVMQLGRGLPLEHTFSCIAPQNGLHCGACNKCAERCAAFQRAGIPDPTSYAKRIGHAKEEIERSC